MYPWNMEPLGVKLRFATFPLSKSVKCLRELFSVSEISFSIRICTRFWRSQMSLDVKIVFLEEFRFRWSNFQYCTTLGAYFVIRYCSCMDMVMVIVISGRISTPRRGNRRGTAESPQRPQRQPRQPQSLQKQPRK